MTAAAPTEAKFGCGGYPATIVGTNASETIVGTNRRDVIVAGGGNDRVFGRGGNDVICGGRGNDRLYGGPGDDRLFGEAGRDLVSGGAGPDRRVDGGNGPDRLYGGPGDDQLFGGRNDDRLVGGGGYDVMVGQHGRDRCRQGPGAGPAVGCEVIAPVEPKDLAIAWSDLDGDHRYGPGDVLISRFFDTNGDGTPSVGDTIYFGRYPLDFELTAFAAWGVTSYKLRKGDMNRWVSGTTLHSIGANRKISPGYYHEFGWDEAYRWAGGQAEYYGDYEDFDGLRTEFIDQIAPPRDRPDSIHADFGSPGQPTSNVDVSKEDPEGIDDGFIDVVVYP